MMNDKNQKKPVGEQDVPLGRHVVVKSIDIVFNDSKINASNTLKVSFKDKELDDKWIEMDLPDSGSKGRDPTHWNFEDGLSLFPNAALTIRPLYSLLDFRHLKGGHRGEIDECEISAKDILSFCDRQPAGSLREVLEYPGPDSEPLAGKNGLSKITLKVFLRDFDEGFEGVDTTSLKPSVVLEGLDSLSSSRSLRDCTSQLRSVFDILDANVAVLQTVTQALENVASAHPLAKAAVSALLIPYKLLEAEHKFTKNLLSLKDEMQPLIKLVADARWIAELTSTKDSVWKIMNAVIDASHFIYKFVKKGRIRTFLRYPCSL